ncbi:hypothetical protein [Desulfovibrio sp.]
MNPPRLLSSRPAALLPPALLLLCLGLWAVDVFIWDEWIIWVHVLEKLNHGLFGLADLAAQQNEQRNLAARLAGLALMPAFGLNRLPECLLNVLLAGACALLAVRLFRLTSRGRAEPPVLAFSLLAFSLLQWETFSVGINSSVLLPVLGVWAGAAVAAAGPPTPGRLAALVLTGLAPSFSFVNGLFFWPCLWPLLLFRAENRSQRLLTLLAWPLLGALVWAAYFAGYQSPAHHPSALSAFWPPWRLPAYVLAYLGGALAGDRNLLVPAMLAGAFSLSALAALLRAAFRAGRDGLDRAAPWLPVIGFSLCSALATAVGRGGFGPGQALESRYATFSGALWMSLAALWVLFGADLSERAARLLRRGLLCCLGLFLLSSVLAAVVLRDHAPRQERAREELFRLTDADALRPVFPDPAYVAAKLPLFLERRLGPYRFLRPFGDYARIDGPAGEFTVEPALGMEGRLGGFRVSGRLEGRARPTVLIAAGERVVGVARGGADGSFELFLPDTALAAGPATLTAFALEDGGRALRPLGPKDGAAVVNRPRPAVFHVDEKFLAG